MTFNIETYLESGIVEDYCLGRLSEVEAQEVVELSKKHHTLKAAIEAGQKSFEKYLTSFKRKPKKGLKAQLMNAIDDEILNSSPALTAQDRLSSFVDLSNNVSSNKHWSRITQALSPPDQFDIHAQEIYNDRQSKLLVVWIKKALPDEVHTSVLEKFIVLEGTCTCMLGNQQLDLVPGDMLEIPLNIVHNLKVTSDTPLKLILSKQKIAS